MSKIYLVYTTDVWHSYSSRDIIGVCTTFLNCMKVIRAHVKNLKRERLSGDNEYDLEKYHQTQGREENYDIEEVEKNTLL